MKNEICTTCGNAGEIWTTDPVLHREDKLVPCWHCQPRVKIDPEKSKIALAEAIRNLEEAMELLRNKQAPHPVFVPILNETDAKYWNDLEKEKEHE